MDEVRIAIQRSFFAWTEQKCKDGNPSSLTFSQTEDVACKKSGFNKDSGNVNVLMFQDTDWKYRGVDGTLAKTTVTFNAESGEILDADIEVNTASNDMTLRSDKIGYDLQSVLTHEVGHFIGIAHSAKPAAIMYASYEPGTLHRELDADDIDALCAIYPPKRGASCSPTPKNGFEPRCDDPSSGGCSMSPLPQGGLGLGLLTTLGVGLIAQSRRRKRDS